MDRTPRPSDRWAAGGAYEQFMGRWSRRLAARFVEWLSLPAGIHWLDVGCGTGALVDAIRDRAEPASVLGCDPSAPFIEFARDRVRDDRASFVVAGAGGLPRRSEGYGCAASLLALNFFPDPAAAVREMRSLTAGGGTVAACVWDYAGGMEFLRIFWNAAAEADPTARAHDEGTRFPLCRPDALTALFRGAGLTDVACDPIEITTEFGDFEDFWSPFLGGAGPAPSYVASLDDEGRAALRQALDRSLPRTPSGTIPLAARAWAVRGIVPGSSHDADRRKP